MTIARYAPGLGDPWDLTPAQWHMALVRINEQLAMESGDRDAISHARLDQTARKQQWQKLSAKRTLS